MKMASRSKRLFFTLIGLAVGIGTMALRIDALAGLPLYEDGPRVSHTCKSKYTKGLSSSCKDLPVTGTVDAAADCITVPAGAVNTSSNNGIAKKVATWGKAGSGKFMWTSPVADAGGASCKARNKSCAYVCRSSTAAEAPAAELARADQLYLYDDAQATLIGSEGQQDVADAASTVMEVVKALPTGERFGETEQQAVLDELSAVSGEAVLLEDIPLTLASSELVQDDFAAAFPDPPDGGSTLPIAVWVVLAVILAGLAFFFLRRRSATDPE